MLQLLAHIRLSSFQLVWQPIFIWLLSCVNHIRESQPAFVAVYTHELFSHEEMMDIKGNTQSIQNWTWKLKPWTLLGITVISSSHLQVWLVFSQLFGERRCILLKRLIWGDRGYGYTQKRLHIFLRWVFIDSFHSRLNFLGLEYIFIWRISLI